MENKGLDLRTLVDRYAFLATNKEDRALKDWIRPIKLKPGKAVELTHPSYRGPWHLVTKDPVDENRTTRIRDGGPTPTRFVFCSPEMREDFESRDARQAPYKHKPVLLEGTTGILLTLELQDFADEKNNSIDVILRNEGKTLNAEGAFKVMSHESFDKDFLEQYRKTGIHTALPVGGVINLQTEDGVKVSLEGIMLEKFSVSFNTKVE